MFHFDYMSALPTEARVRGKLIDAELLRNSSAHSSCLWINGLFLFRGYGPSCKPVKNIYRTESLKNINCRPLLFGLLLGFIQSHSLKGCWDAQQSAEKYSKCSSYFYIDINISFTKVDSFWKSQLSAWSGFEIPESWFSHHIWSV